jgi:hypothetical protein
LHFGGIRTVIAVEKKPEPKVLHKSQEPPSMVYTSVGAVTQFGGLEMKVFILARRKKTKTGSDFWNQFQNQTFIFLESQILGSFSV